MFKRTSDSKLIRLIITFSLLRRFFLRTLTLGSKGAEIWSARVVPMCQDWLRTICTLFLPRSVDLRLIEPIFLALGDLRKRFQICQGKPVLTEQKTKVYTTPGAKYAIYKKCSWNVYNKRWCTTTHYTKHTFLCIAYLDGVDSDDDVAKLRTYLKAFWSPLLRIRKSLLNLLASWSVVGLKEPVSSVIWYAVWTFSMLTSNSRLTLLSFSWSIRDWTLSNSSEILRSTVIYSSKVLT